MIAQIDIQTKVRRIQELLENSYFEKMIHSFIARHCAENSDARLAGIVIWSDRPYLENFTRGTSKQWKSTKFTSYMLKKSRTCFFWGCRTAGGRPPPVAQLGGNYHLGGTLKPVKNVRICLNMSVYVHICSYMSIYVHICPYIATYISRYTT